MSRSETHDELLIEGLHESQVHQRGVELVCNALAWRDHGAHREDRKAAAAFAPHLRFADGKRAHRGVDRRTPVPACADNAPLRVD